MLPFSVLAAPIVADVPGKKYTLQALAPSFNTIFAAAALTNVVSTRKINWPLEFPRPLSVSVPVRSTAEVGKV